MRDHLIQFAAATGESLLAVEPDRLGVEARDGAATPGAGIAVIPLQGGLTPRGLTFFGRVLVPGMDAFRAAGDRAAADPNVAAIVLDVNTPGGTYAGTPETAAAVARWAQVKPVVAVVDTLMASAGYFIGSQASEIVVTPSGEVGSIGVLATHLDFSKMLENDGVTPTIIRSRASKADANPYEPLSAEAKAAIEASVREADAEFLKAVAKGRNMSLPQVRQLADEGGFGRLMSGKAAVAAGMADRVATMGEVLAGMVKPRAAAKRRSALAFL
jgi:signal peptide peptidase SppA